MKERPGMLPKDSKDRTGGECLTGQAASRAGARHARKKLLNTFLAVRSKLTGTLNRILHNHEDARDAVQEAFLKCWGGAGRATRIRDLQAWIFRIGLNSAKDIQRSAWRRKARPLSAAAGREESRALAPDLAAEEREDEQRLQKAVADLRPEEQHVFQLRQTGRMTHEEIAEVLRSPVGTVKTRLRAALSKLRHALQRRRSQGMAARRAPAKR
jgi:RNA polymerase sigma-70 factor (ECF subfamily)